MIKKSEIVKWVKYWIVAVVGLFACTAVQAATKVYYIHSDHLGTPQVMTDATQTVVWRADYQPFGEAVVDEDPNGDGIVVEMPLRFPGQYYDKETGLHYNYFRDYDPTLGRYLQSDPIGLRGGINTYGYVYQNPLIYTDSRGLAVCAGICIGVGIGATAYRAYRAYRTAKSIAGAAGAISDSGNQNSDASDYDDDAANDPVHDVELCLLECDLEALDGAEDCLTNQCLDDNQYQECLRFVELRYDACEARCLGR